MSVPLPVASDVPLPYLTAGIFSALPDPVDLRDRSSVLASAWISSPIDQCGRVAYLRELVQCLPVASFGKVENNTVIDLDHGQSTKLEAIRRYRFTVAFENSRAQDYVTEKFFQPLIAGSTEERRTSMILLPPRIAT
jgi:Glycosyltransferase family 10 (fucosyltransferase) C-term